jgi:hypothetical protein
MNSIEYRCEFRDTTGAQKFVTVEVDGVELDSVNTLRLRSGSEQADAMAYAYATRRGYAAAPAGFSLHSAERL